MRVISDRDVRERQNIIIVVLVATIVVLAVAWILWANFARQQNQQAALNQPAPTTGAGPGSAAPPGTMPGGTLAPSGTTPSAPSAGTQQSPGVTSAPPPPSVSEQAPKPVPPKTTTVAGSVVVSYPGRWSVSEGDGGSAIMTDGKATVEVKTAGSDATDAKSAADAVLADRAPNADIKAQGERKVGGHDAYAYMLSTSSGPMRIVGIDAPTRIVIIESASTDQQFAAHKTAFDRIESGLRYK